MSDRSALLTEGEQRRFWVLVALPLSLALLAYAGQILSATLASRAPVGLIAMIPADPFLILTVNEMPTWAFFTVGFIRLTLPDPLLWRIGFEFGPAAKTYLDTELGTNSGITRAVNALDRAGKHLDTKLDRRYPVNAHLRMLLDDIVEDSRWDMTYLGMQIMVEGLALAAFGFMYQQTEEPLLKKLLRYVMSDEARHVAFGVLSLREVYADLTQAELRERQEFAFEAALRMRDRFLQQEVWERMGADVSKVLPVIFDNEDRREFQHLLFTKIVPNCKKLGLLDGGDGWLRKRFEEINVIQYEDWIDTAEEVDSFAIQRELEGEDNPLVAR